MIRPTKGQIKRKDTSFALMPFLVVALNPGTVHTNAMPPLMATAHPLLLGLDISLPPQATALPPPARLLPC